MRFQQFLATSVATMLLLAPALHSSFARGGKKEAGNEMPAKMNQQFQWEDKVVGPEGRAG